MLRFSAHALDQFAARRPDLFPAGTPHPDTVDRLAREGFYLGQLITRDEASERIGGPVYSGMGDIYFREDGQGPGVWVVWRTPRKAEVVITYLTRGMKFGFAEAQAAMHAFQ